MTIAMPADWVTYEALAAGIDENRLPQSTALDGRTIAVQSEDGTERTFTFSRGTAEWIEVIDGRTSTGRDDADVVEVNPGTFFVDIWLRSRSDTEALTIILNEERGRVLTVHTIVRDEYPVGEPRVAQEFSAGTVVGVTPTGAAPALTRDLIGRRLFNDYSPQHYYEHVYLNTGRYVWQCLSGVQKGHGDCDLATYYKFDEDTYVFCFREFRIPVASVLFLDFGQMRNTGKFLGIEGDGSLNNAGCGALVSWLATDTDYPQGAEPV